MWNENLAAILEQTTEKNNTNIPSTIEILENETTADLPEDERIVTAKDINDDDDDESTNSVDDFLTAITSPNHQDSTFNSTIVPPSAPPPPLLAIQQPNTSLWDMPVFHDKQTPLVGSVKSIGVDYGLVRTGVAVTVGYDPTPLAILTDYDYNNTLVCTSVLDYARAQQVSKIIVGLPLHKNGTVANQTNLTLVFAEELAHRTLATLGPDVFVELWDERYTSKEAAARAHALDPGRALYGSLDADAACIILEHYYSDGGQGRFRVPVVPERMRQECLRMYQQVQAHENKQRQSLLSQRSERMQRRKQAIAQQQQQQQQRFDGMSTKKKKKKKRKK